MAAPASPAVLSDDIVRLVESGVMVMVATRDANLTPECSLSFGARVHADRQTVTLYFPEVANDATRANLLADGRVAVVMNRPRDEVTVQLKGEFLRLRPMDSDDLAAHTRCQQNVEAQLISLGVPPAVCARFNRGPLVAVDFRARDVFNQTPGPDAGKRVATL